MKTRIVLLVVLLVLAVSSALPAQVPQLINYQGRVGVNGINYDGTGQFKFALVNATGTMTYWSNDGTSSAGSEPVASVAVTVSKGLYSVLLGDATLPGMTVVPATVFTHADVHLRIWFSDGSHGSQLLAPDKRIAAVGYAMMADSVTDASITTAKIADGAVTSAKLAPGVVQTSNLAAGAVGNAQLANSSLTLTAGAGLAGGGVVSLGGTIALSNTGVLDLTGSGGITVDTNTGNITLGTTATSANTAGAIVARDASGNFSAGTITGSLNGSATNFTASLSGDVTGTQTATAIADSTVTSKLLTGFASTPGTLTATDTLLTAINKLHGNDALKAPLASPIFTGSVTLPEGTTSVAPIQLQSGTSLTTPAFGAMEFDGTNLFLTNNSASPTRKTIAFTDSIIASSQIPSGSITSAKLAPNLSLGGITSGAFSGPLIGDVTGNVSGSADSFTGSLNGDVTGTQSATVVSNVGGVTASNVASGANLANASTSANTSGTVVKRDANGNFSAGTIAAALNGHASTATNFTGVLVGEVTGTQGATAIAASTITGKAIIGFASSAGGISANDTLLSAINKLDGNDALKAPLASPTFTGSVTLPAGTASAAPILLQSGTSLSTPVAGAMEFDGTHLFVTTSGDSPIRKTIAFTDSVFGSGQIASGAVNSSHLASGLTLGGTTSGTFSGPLTGNVTGNVTGSAASFTGALVGDVTGTQGATVVSVVGGVSAMSIAAGSTLANAAASTNTPGGIVRRDVNGNFSAGTISATLAGNATTATTAGSFTGLLVGDVTGTQGATVVSMIGTSTALQVHNAEVLANAATSISVAGTLVKRDANGDFSAGTITAALNGNATSATTFTGSLAGDVTGTQEATTIAASIVTGKALTGFASSAGILTAADSILSAINKLDGNLALKAPLASPAFTGTVSGTFVGALTGNVTGNVSGSAGSFTGTLSGDVTGTQGSTVVATVGGISAANVVSGVALAQSATAVNTSSTLVARDANGNFAAGTITAALNGNAATATTAGSASSFTGTLAGDVTGTQDATVISASTLMGKVITGFASSAGTVTSSDTLLAAINKLNGNIALKSALDSPVFTGSVRLPSGTASAAPLNLQTGIVQATPTFGAVEFDGMNLFVTVDAASPTRKTLAFTDSVVSSGQIANGAVTSAKLASGLTLGGTTTGTFAGPLTGNVTGNVSGSAGSFTGSLAGDVTGAQGATVVANVGGISAADVASGASSANAATSGNTAGSLVKRDASGNFSAGVISAALNGHATTATSFTGALAGDVTGNQGNTVVASVGGVSAGSVAAASSLANGGTSANTAGTLVKRDASGNFSAGTITANLNGNASTATNATTATGFSGSLMGDVTGTQSATAIADSIVTGKALTGFVSTTGTVTAADSVLSAFGKLNGSTTTAMSDLADIKERMRKLEDAYLIGRIDDFAYRGRVKPAVPTAFVWEAFPSITGSNGKVISPSQGNYADSQFCALRYVVEDLAQVEQPANAVTGLNIFKSLAVNTKVHRAEGAFYYYNGTGVPGPVRVTFRYTDLTFASIDYTADTNYPMYSALNPNPTKTVTVVEFYNQKVIATGNGEHSYVKNARVTGLGEANIAISLAPQSANWATFRAVCLGAREPGDSIAFSLSNGVTTQSNLSFDSILVWTGTSPPTLMTITLTPAANGSVKGTSATSIGIFY